MFIYNKYYITYFKIINRAQQRTLPTGVKFEVHHILPRSLGGTDNIDNLVKLTLKEHWVCHRLLVKFLNNPAALRKMYNALYMMAVKDYRTINGRIYQSIKENIVPWNKGLTGLKGKPHTAESKQKLSNLWKGKSRPQEHKSAMRAGWDKAKNNGYQPWNKGITGFKGPCRPITLISPDGIHHRYESMKQGCKEHNLIYTKMSSVKNGHLLHHKGWTVATDP
jgi:HNH endonuclease